MSKDLGKSTSYAYYVAEGGTKTPQEYGEMLVNIDTVATRAEDAADSAAESAMGALNSKNAAQTAATTATNKASEATTAATTATTKAGEASTSASTATSAKDTAVSASQTATSKATEATTAAATATSAKTDAVAANTAAQSAKTAAQTAQTGAETAAASVSASAAQIATNAADISQLKSDLNNIENSMNSGHYELYDKTKNTVGQYLKKDGTIGTQSGWNITDYMPVATNARYYCYGQVSSASVKTCFYDSSKTFIADSGLRIYSQKYYQILTIPINAKYVRFSISDSIVDTFKYDLIISTSPSIWNAKKYISHGDSITWQDGKAYTQGDHIGETARGYQTVFSEAVGLATINNQGASGYSMAVVNSNGVVNVITGISNYNYDLCTIACGTNDFKLNVPLGTIGQIGDTTFDDTTFYGAYRKSIEHILTEAPTIRIVLITPLQRDNAGYDVNYTNSAGHKLIDYVNAVKAIGEMYGLPVCDMYANSGFTKKTLATYTMDGLHPNDVGYKRMGEYLTGFLNAVGN